MGVYDCVELTPPSDGFNCWRYSARWESASKYGGFSASRTEYLNGECPHDVTTEGDARTFCEQKFAGFSISVIDLEKIRERRRKLAKENANVPAVDESGKRLSRAQRRAIQFNAGN